MGIESLNSAVAAAGFAMVSDDVVEGQHATHDVRVRGRGDHGHRSEPAVSAGLPAVRTVEPASPSLGARVSGLLDALRPKS